MRVVFNLLTATSQSSLLQPRVHSSSRRPQSRSSAPLLPNRVHRLQAPRLFLDLSRRSRERLSGTSDTYAFVLYHATDTDLYPSQKPVQPTVAITSRLAVEAPISIKIESPASSAGEESALDDLFARLNAQGGSKLSSSDQSASPPRPKGSIFSFEDGAGVQDAGSDMLRGTSAFMARETMGSDARDLITSTIVLKTDEAAQPAGKDKIDETGSSEGMSRADVEQLYLRKAADYLETLPSGNSVTVDIIKSVSKKLRTVYAPNAKLSSEEADKLKDRCAFAILNYVNRTYKKAAKPITSEIAKKALHDANGDMLRVYAKLVEEKYLFIEDIDSIAGMCRMITDALPKADAASAPATPKPGPNTPVVAVRDPTSSVSAGQDPLAGLKTWPTQEKRETRKLHTATQAML